jgi:RNA-directed DNA polymerase
MNSIRRFLERRLRLRINEEKSSVTRPEGVHFLGFRFGTSAAGGVEVLLSVRTEERVSTRIRELTPRTWGRSLRTAMEELNRYLEGWMGYLRLCTAKGATVFRRYDAHIRRRLRAIIIHQKKRPRFLYRHLLARGTSPQQAAGGAYSRRGVWHRSNRPGMTQAYSNAWFQRYLTPLEERWARWNPPATISGQLCLVF